MSKKHRDLECEYNNKNMTLLIKQMLYFLDSNIYSNPTFNYSLSSTGAPAFLAEEANYMSQYYQVSSRKEYQ